MNYLKILGIAVIGVVMGIAMGGIATAKELKLADFLPPNHPYQTKVYGVLAEKIAKATNGEVTIKIFPGGALGGGPIEQYNRAVDGVADITFALPGYTASNFPMTLLTELPGVISEKEGTAKIWENIEFLSDEYQRVKLLAIWTNGENVLYMRDKPIRSLADIQGLKIRVPSRNAGLVVKSWGAVPISMPVPEIYNALQTGVVDGVLIDTTATYAFKLGEVSKFVTSGMNGTISPFALLMNIDSYNSLSKEQQAIMDSLGREVSVLGNKVQLAGTKRGAQMFKDQKGVKWIDLSDEKAAEFNAASSSVLKTVTAEAEAKGLKAQAFIDALSK